MILLIVLSVLANLVWRRNLSIWELRSAFRSGKWAEVTRQERHNDGNEHVNYGAAYDP